jgi:hypothetical protein
LQAVTFGQALPVSGLGRHLLRQRERLGRADFHVEGLRHALPDPLPPKRLVHEIESFVARRRVQRRPHAGARQPGGIRGLGEHAVVHLVRTREAQWNPGLLAERGKHSHHHHDVHRVADDVADHHVRAQDRPFEFSRACALAQDVFLGVIKIGRQVARIVLIERRDRAAQVHAIHLGALVMHHARERRPGRLQAVEQVAQHGGVERLLLGQVAPALQRGVEHVGGVAGGFEGRGRGLGVEQVGLDGLDAVGEGARQGPHVPVGTALQLTHDGVADDAAGAGDQGGVLTVHGFSFRCGMGEG